MGRVHVLGNACADLVLRVPRAPEDGETMLARAGRRAPGGKGLNQAVVAARAGAIVRLRVVVGEDADAAMIAAALGAERLERLELIAVALPTDLSVVIVDDAGGNRIVSTSACADSVTEADAAAFAAEVAAGDVLLMQGNLSNAATAAAARIGVRRGGLVVINLAPCRFSLAEAEGALDGCCLVLNAIEALQVSGLDDPRAAATALCRAGAARVVVTLGAAGCALAEGGAWRSYPGNVVAALDTTGAGDTFSGVLAAALARGLGMEAGIVAAQHAAAITVTRHGVFEALPRAGELSWWSTASS